MKENASKSSKLHTVEEYNKKHNNKLPEIIGEKVILAPIPDSNEFYELYLKWISNEDLKRKLGEEGTKYTWQEIPSGTAIPSRCGSCGCIRSPIQGYAASGWEFDPEGIKRTARTVRTTQNQNVTKHSTRM